MSQTNLSDFGVFNKESEMETPLIFSDEHIEDLYKSSHHYKVLQDYKRLIDEKLEEERLEKENWAKQSPVKTKYIRIGGR